PIGEGWVRGEAEEQARYGLSKPLTLILSQKGEGIGNQEKYMNLSLRENIALVLSLVVLSTSQTVTVAQTIDGFSGKASDAERRLEEQLRAVPSPATARE